MNFTCGGEFGCFSMFDVEGSRMVLLLLASMNAEDDGIDAFGVGKLCDEEKRGGT